MEEFDFSDDEEEEEEEEEEFILLDIELRRAASNGNLERVKQHIEAGADVNYMKVN